VSDWAKPQTPLPFATTTYRADQYGVLRPELPSRCVFATGAQTCSIFVDHYRFRKTGPRFSLAVVGCTVHPVHRYTLYPPGHFPYGRERMAPYSPTGELLRDSETGRPPWEATVFAAAVDAADGERWSSNSPWDDSRRYRTQGRRLQWAGRLVGVHKQLDARIRERIATRLGVATMRLLEEAKSWMSDWKRRGAAILSVLTAIPLQTSLLDRMLVAGAESGLWASRYPQRWDADRSTWNILFSPSSQSSEHPVTAVPQNRSPPPTNSPDAGVVRTGVLSDS
jgi:hypothetical protein